MRRQVYFIFEAHDAVAMQGHAVCRLRWVCVWRSWKINIHSFYITASCGGRRMTRWRPPMVAATQQRFSQLTQCSVDKGFYTPGNLAALDGCLDKTILPKKGRLAEADNVGEHRQDYIQARHQHCSIDWCINNLQGRGLDRCLSYGKHGFERPVALSVVASTLHRLGLILQRQQRARLEKQGRHKPRVAP